VVITIRLTPAWAVRCCTAVEQFVQSRRTWTARGGMMSRALAVILGGLTLSAAATTEAPASMRPLMIIIETDPRIARLDRFFKLYHCTTPYHTGDYLRTADGFGLDYRLLPAVAIRETQCGITAKAQNNHWGYHPGHQSFLSVAEGLEVVAKRLAQNPLYRGKTLQDKLFTYNPKPAYPGEVLRIMRQIE
jgi:hypothetical protein